jgi:imidazole glycerol-phosphate synthase subunit HisF
VDIRSLLSQVQRKQPERSPNSVDKDGTMAGYDLSLIRTAVQSVDIPVVAIGGAGSPEHLNEALHEGASAVAAGSMFVFHGKHRAVLISYLSNEQRSLLVTSGRV